MKKTRFLGRTTVLGLTLGYLALASAPVLGADYPAKPVTIIVGFGAGGQNDVAARVLANKLSETMGQPFIVENRPGASGNIATEAVARSAPDGYTLMLVATSVIYNATLFPQFEINPSDDLVGITRVATYPLYVVVPTSMPDTLAGVIAEAKAHPGELNYAISGFGTSTHIATEFFSNEAGIELTAIPYKGGAEAATATVANETQLHFGGTAVLPLIDAGKLRLLAVTTDSRVQKFPDVPTVSETVPGFSFNSWNGIFAPAGTPSEVLETLNAAMVGALQSSDVIEAYKAVDLEPSPMSVEDFNRYYRDEQANWGAVITKAGITVE